MPVFCDEDDINKGYDSPQWPIKTSVSTCVNMPNILPWTNLGSLTNFEPCY